MLNAGGRLIGAIFGALGAAVVVGCGIKIVSVPVYTDYAKLVPFRCTAPLAREVRYTYTETSDIKLGPDGFVSVADEATLAEYEQTGTVPMLSRTASLSDTLSERGRQASATGRYDQAYLYHDLAISAAEIESAMSRVQSSANLLTSYVGAMNALGRLAPVLARQSAERVVGWLHSHTGCIGASAPDSSVLHVDLNRVFHATAFTVASRTDFQVTAVLDDGRGRLFRAERGYPMFVYQGDSLPEDLGSEAVPANPVQDFGDFENIYDAHLAVLANSAVAELSRQLEEQQGP